MTSSKFRIVYDGPALAENAMEVRDLAPALLALAEVIEHANRSLNDDRAQIKIQVHGSFRSGSFGVDMDVVQSVSQQLLSILADDKRIVGTVNLLALLGFVTSSTVGLVRLLKWLKGRKISRVVIKDDKSPAVLIVDDESIAIEQTTLTIFRSYQVRRALERTISDPLDREGVESVAFVHEESVTETVQKSERRYFVAPAEEPTDIDEREFEVTLQIVNVPMRDGYVWRFDDGSGAFSAAVTDDAFLHRFKSNLVPFTPGDILRARVRRRQFLEDGKLKTETEVIKVINHDSAYRQLPLDIVQRKD